VPEELGQMLLPLLDRAAPQVRAVNLDQIEGTERRDTVMTKAVKLVSLSNARNYRRRSGAVGTVVMGCVAKHSHTPITRKNLAAARRRTY
jgi:hypothetical protein